MTEHLIVFPDKETAEQIAAELEEEGFTSVRVLREALAGEDDSEAHEWGVHVIEKNIVDQAGAVEQALNARFAALAEDHDGWYDPNPKG